MLLDDMQPTMAIEDYAKGGIIDEPVVGIGYRTRRPYFVHERATGTPLASHGKHDAPTVIETHFHVVGQIAPEDAARSVRRALRLVDIERR